MRVRISSQQKIISSLQKQNNQLASKQAQHKTIHSVLKNKVTVPKLNCLINGLKRPKKWSQQDIVDGLVLRSFSKRSYQFLRRKYLLPLPGLTTLRTWVQNFQCLPGIQTDILKVLEGKLSGELPEHYRLAILSFDEMAIKTVYEYHHGQDQVYGPHSRVQLAVLRGLVYKWKLPIYYQFDAPMTKSLLFQIIQQVEKHRAQVCGVSCDLGNRQLMSELDISPENPSFANPADPNRLIYFFPDVPHLLKLIRNHLLDQVSIKSKTGLLSFV